MVILLTGDSFFFWCGNLTGSVDRNLVNTSCALLMMEATASETSPMLDCYVLVECFCAICTSKTNSHRSNLGKTTVPKKNMIFYETQYRK